MKFPSGISLILFLVLTIWNCSGIKKDPSQTTDEQDAVGSSLAYSENDSPPRDSIIQSYFSDEYSIHVVASVTGTDILPLPEYMWMIVYNSNGRKTFLADRWFLDLEHGVKPLEPEWPDYFLIHVHNLGNCCTCTADYLFKVTKDEIKIIGEVNDYINGKFYVNICDWPIDKAHVQMTLSKHEVPLVNDTLRYPDGYKI